MAFWYSVRFSRWNGSVRPGLGCAAAARSSSAFEPADEAVVRGLVRTRPAGRRHETGAELPHDLFPRSPRRRRHSRVERVQRDRNRAPLLQPLVVTGEAVALEHRLLSDGLRQPPPAAPGPRPASGQAEMSSAASQIAASAGTPAR